MDIMNILGNYIQIDIFSDRCKGVNVTPSPCSRLPTGSNTHCESERHQPYRFYLAFENSLCKDYISEKFWDRLESPGYFVPVALGGLSLDDYTSVAPPNSFLHVYNFTSVHQLGRYLKYLMENDKEYNAYHSWRYDYEITTKRSMPACELCRIANEKPAMPALQSIADWRNNASTCWEYQLHKEAASENETEVSDLLS
ncbi:alpha-(1,3)-fucosyltransferase fut-1-like [Watersipora subatra]|uniref:alpha-(1,3)-fucosyltransferase fut-1-like n=1 Tax=Watersipora subatra TaxID=2589382 RepID=UPI00355ADED6